MRKMMNKVISKIKGEPYEIDKDIPTGYLIHLAFVKLLQLQRGFWNRIHFCKHHKGKRVFIGSHVKLSARKLIRCGRGVTIGDYSYINALSRGGITIGNNVSFGRNTIIECTGVISELGEELIIGDNVGIAANAFLGVRGKVVIGKDTIIGPNFDLHSENHVFSNLDKPFRLQGTIRHGIQIGENCWIGANVTVLDGVHIGNGSIIAAGAVVTSDIPDNSVAGGVPCKILRTRIKE
jgi:acetyltransferase-like isoleucine patch superfamily enzyme